ncbi:3-methyladenine DNA glycosylase [Subtercola boreus]|uniref:3-methyladenine DNA glycosylase n=1 Tax=Subtercola boreus TaxID=120213 RepID=A0A3E0WAL7_9MICO|nr:3-methyladenine DNA glycosylase [Subtercola boreus]RFA21456.1 3-methyladenine DNA glycosylase [Subtercola boreus]RFA27427.1 3-methyladenine DNA glycosylase [Subtercola boreus]
MVGSAGRAVAVSGASAGASVPATVVLSLEVWTALEARHQERADDLTAGWRSRRATGVAHPIDDFLFTYYPYKPSLLRRWHPGAGVTLADTADRDRHAWRWYARVAGPRSSAATGAHSTVDAAGFLAARASTVDFIERLLRQTAARPAQFGCFGLHEWAMVYRVPAGGVRHEFLPLRLTSEQTDRVVESNRIACSHFDAFRFFTPEAVGTNALQPTRESQPDLEQPGCLHAGMDVYKWAIKLGPLVPGEVLLDCFELARDIRQLDMQASPYDVSSFGLHPVRIETRDGKAEYSRRQRGFRDRSNALRMRVVAAVERAREVAAVETTHEVTASI